ncbi:SigE family RNA polymerase sigma factor [Promicromonospora sukumoe]|uniref:SigE family RNA polymerase sigma factor n=1 Tax=Promicromonospora sukumoe TaxID=88382 RepID=UPI000376A042|nr:SigE family RNA polymerase sigma factor [Promicromonospora sukumoe]
MVQWETELTELVVRRGGALVGYAYSLTRDKAQAEDLVQDALVKVYSRLRRPPRSGEAQVDLRRSETTSAEAYVRRAILTIYLDGYRRRNHWVALKHLLAEDAHTPGADRVATARVDVGVALRRLSPRQREVVILRYFDDLTVPQIAAALGTSQGTVKRHLFDAAAVLRDALAEVTAPEVDTSLDERLDAVTGAIRRRRTAKVAAIGGVSLVLIVLLGFAAAWGPGRFLSEHVPPATPSPETSSDAVGAGWAPSGWSGIGEQYLCGMDVTALTSTSDTVRLELTGDVEAADGGDVRDDFLSAPVRIVRTDAEGPDLDGGRPHLVFARNGQVVDLGRGWREGGYALPGAGGSVVRVAEADAFTACGAWTTKGPETPWEEYLDPRPAGTYDVYAVMSWTEGDGVLELVVSEPVTMEVPAVDVPDEEPLAVGIREGYQPPWLEGTSLACGDHASDIPGRFYDSWGPELLTVSSSAQRMSFWFENKEGPDVDTTRTPPTLVWLSGGRVVSVGSDVRSEPVERFRVDDKGSDQIHVAIGDPDPACLLDPAAGMPEGDYEAYALMEIAPGSGGERRFISTGFGETISYRPGR